MEQLWYVYLWFFREINWNFFEFCYFQFHEKFSKNEIVFDWWKFYKLQVCLHNLRKTFKYGGRKNVPSIEEITAISAGRNSKRQIYRLPGGKFDNYFINFIYNLQTEE